MALDAQGFLCTQNVQLRQEIEASRDLKGNHGFHLGRLFRPRIGQHENHKPDSRANEKNGRESGRNFAPQKVSQPRRIVRRMTLVDRQEISEKVHVCFYWHCIFESMPLNWTSLVFQQTKDLSWNPSLCNLCKIR